MRDETIMDKLKGGDLRSIGKADQVAREVLADPTLFSVVFNGMLSGDPVVRMRAADAVEKITREQPDLLIPFKKILIERVAGVEQQEVCWHVAQMLPRLALHQEEQEQVIAILFEYLEHKSKIVQVNALQSLSDIAEKNEYLAPRVISVLKQMSVSGSAAVKSRAQKLLKRLEST